VVEAERALERAAHARLVVDHEDLHRPRSVRVPT
jgi:hypothetical protein